MLRESTREKILDRVRRLLAQIDPEAHLLEVTLDSTRQQLIFVMQKGEWPIVIPMEWLEYVSHRDGDLLARLRQGLTERLEASKKRQAPEAD